MSKEIIINKLLSLPLNETSEVEKLLLEFDDGDEVILKHIIIGTENPFVALQSLMKLYKSSLYTEEKSRIMSYIIYIAFLHDDLTVRVNAISLLDDIATLTRFTRDDDLEIREVSAIQVYKIRSMLFGKTQ